MPIREFMREHFRHFNAATTVDAAQAYADVTRQLLETP